jgi:hypothetical protein
MFQGHDLSVTKVKPTVNTILVTPKSDLGVEQTDLSPTPAKRYKARLN